MSATKKSNRKEEILQALAQMLESNEGTSRITTAKLAKQVGVSEAASIVIFPAKPVCLKAYRVYRRIFNVSH